MAEAPRAERPSPSCRPLIGLTAIKISRFAGDTSAHAALQGVGLAFPSAPRAQIGSGPWLVWLNPRETLAVAENAAPLRQLLANLASGHSDTAMALDLSESLAAFVLEGPCLDDWLSHLVDAAAIPRETGCSTRCRLVDVPVTLLRLQPECMWLLADRPLASYLADWLAYAHAGAFAASAR